MATVIVPSEKNAGVSYVVDTEARTCTCPQYVNRLAKLNENNPPDEWVYCKHVKQARDEQAQAMREAQA